MNQSPRLKNTPGRRRPGRNNHGNNTPQKSYVSENDLASYQAKDSDQQLVSPSTPLKVASGQKPRAKNNKTRNKNGAGSPSQQHKQSSAQSIPVEVPAAIFAGATFHASPAPSSLPMPSFLARSNAESPLQKSSLAVHATPSPQQEPSPPSTDSEDGQGFKQTVTDRNNDSPLEFFFRAQRAEKDKDNRAKSANAAPSVAPGPFSPPHGSPMEPRTLPRTLGSSQAPPDANMPRTAGPGISAIELDGTPGRSLGPAFSTPYSERIRAARPGPPSKGNRSEIADSPYNESQALLRMLHHGTTTHNQQPPHTSAPHQQHYPYYSASPAASNSQQDIAQYRPPPQYQQHQPHHTSYNQPSYPSYQASPHNHGLIPSHVDGQPQQSFGAPEGDRISTLEASLRQVLKLDSST